MHRRTLPLHPARETPLQPANIGIYEKLAELKDAHDLSSKISAMQKLAKDEAEATLNNRRVYGLLSETLNSVLKTLCQTYKESAQNNLIHTLDTDESLLKMLSVVNVLDTKNVTVLNLETIPLWETLRTYVEHPEATELLVSLLPKQPEGHKMFSQFTRVFLSPWGVSCSLSSLFEEHEELVFQYERQGVQLEIRRSVAQLQLDHEQQSSFNMALRLLGEQNCDTQGPVFLELLCRIRVALWPSTSFSYLVNSCAISVVSCLISPQSYKGFLKDQQLSVQLCQLFLHPRCPTKSRIRILKLIKQNANHCSQIISKLLQNLNKQIIDYYINNTQSSKFSAQTLQDQDFLNGALSTSHMFNLYQNCSELAIFILGCNRFITDIEQTASSIILDTSKQKQSEDIKKKISWLVDIIKNDQSHTNTRTVHIVLLHDLWYQAESKMEQEGEDPGSFTPQFINTGVLTVLATLVQPTDTDDSITYHIMQIVMSILAFDPLTQSASLNDIISSILAMIQYNTTGNYEIIYQSLCFLTMVLKKVSDTFGEQISEQHYFENTIKRLSDGVYSTYLRKQLQLRICDNIKDICQDPSSTQSCFKGIDHVFQKALKEAEAFEESLQLFLAGKPESQNKLHQTTYQDLNWKSNLALNLIKSLRQAGRSDLLSQIYKKIQKYVFFSFWNMHDPSLFEDYNDLIKIVSPEAKQLLLIKIKQLSRKLLRADLQVNCSTYELYLEARKDPSLLNRARLQNGVDLNLLQRLIQVCLSDYPESLYNQQFLEPLLSLQSRLRRLRAGSDIQIARNRALQMSSSSFNRHSVSVKVLTSPPQLQKQDKESVKKYPHAKFEYIVQKILTASASKFDPLIFASISKCIQEEVCLLRQPSSQNLLSDLYHTDVILKRLIHLLELSPQCSATQSLSMSLSLYSFLLYGNPERLLRSLNQIVLACNNASDKIESNHATMTFNIDPLKKSVLNCIYVLLNILTNIPRGNIQSSVESSSRRTVNFTLNRLASGVAEFIKSMPKQSDSHRNLLKTMFCYMLNSLKYLRGIANSEIPIQDMSIQVIEDENKTLSNSQFAEEMHKKMENLQKDIRDYPNEYAFYWDEVAKLFIPTQTPKLKLFYQQLLRELRPLLYHLRNNSRTTESCSSVADMTRFRYNITLLNLVLKRLIQNRISQQPVFRIHGNLVNNIVSFTSELLRNTSDSSQSSYFLDELVAKCLELMDLYAQQGNIKQKQECQPLKQGKLEKRKQKEKQQNIISYSSFNDEDSDQDGKRPDIQNSEHSQEKMSEDIKQFIHILLDRSFSISTLSSSTFVSLLDLISKCSLSFQRFAYYPHIQIEDLFPKLLDARLIQNTHNNVRDRLLEIVNSSFTVEYLVANIESVIKSLFWREKEITLGLLKEYGHKIRATMGNLPIISKVMSLVCEFKQQRLRGQLVNMDADSNFNDQIVILKTDSKLGYYCLVSDKPIKCWNYGPRGQTKSIIDALLVNSIKESFREVRIGFQKNTDSQYYKAVSLQYTLTILGDILRKYPCMMPYIARFRCADTLQSEFDRYGESFYKYLLDKTLEKSLNFLELIVRVFAFLNSSGSALSILQIFGAESYILLETRGQNRTLSNIMRAKLLSEFMRKRGCLGLQLNNFILLTNLTRYKEFCRMCIYQNIVSRLQKFYLIVHINKQNKGGQELAEVVTAAIQIIRSADIAFKVYPLEIAIPIGVQAQNQYTPDSFFVGGSMLEEQGTQQLDEQFESKSKIDNTLFQYESIQKQNLRVSQEVISQLFSQTTDYQQYLYIPQSGVAQELAALQTIAEKNILNPYIQDQKSSHLKFLCHKKISDSMKYYQTLTGSHETNDFSTMKQAREQLLKEGPLKLKLRLEHLKKKLFTPLQKQLKDREGSPASYKLQYLQNAWREKNQQILRKIWQNISQALKIEQINSLQSATQNLIKEGNHKHVSSKQQNSIIPPNAQIQQVCYTQKPSYLKNQPEVQLLTLAKVFMEQRKNILDKLITKKEAQLDKLLPASDDFIFELLCQKKLSQNRLLIIITANRGAASKILAILFIVLRHEHVRDLFPSTGSQLKKMLLQQPTQLKKGPLHKGCQVQSSILSFLLKLSVDNPSCFLMPHNNHILPLNHRFHIEEASYLKHLIQLALHNHKMQIKTVLQIILNVTTFLSYTDILKAKSHKHTGISFSLQLDKQTLQSLCSLLLDDDYCSQMLTMFRLILSLLSSCKENLTMIIDQLVCKFKTIATEIDQDLAQAEQSQSQYQNPYLKLLNILDIAFQTQRSQFKRRTNLLHQPAPEVQRELVRLFTPFLQSETLLRAFKLYIPQLLQQSNSSKKARKIEYLFNSLTHMYNLTYCSQVNIFRTSIKVDISSFVSSAEPPQPAEGIMELEEVQESDKLQKQIRSFFQDILQNHKKWIDKILKERISQRAKSNKYTNSLLDDPLIHVLLNHHPESPDFLFKREIFSAQIQHLRNQYSNQELIVNRESLLDDAVKFFSQIKDSQELRRHLIIYFQGQQGGGDGLTKEFFTELSKQMTNLDYGLLTNPNEKNRYSIFSGTNITIQNGMSIFRVLGRILGKALFEEKIICFSFTPAVYKHLTGHSSITMADLEQEEQSSYFNIFCMQFLMNEFHGRTFVKTVNAFGTHQLVNLIQNGSEIEVTQDNKQLFLEKYLEYHFITSIKKQMRDLLQGFDEVLPYKLISMFNYLELEMLLSGIPHINIADMKTHAQIHSQVNPQLAEWLFQVLQTYSQQKRALFLQFTMGTMRLPPGGFADLHRRPFQIYPLEKGSNSAEHFPAAHTCFNRLELPNYPSKEKLIQKLDYILQPGVMRFWQEQRQTREIRHQVT